MKSNSILELFRFHETVSDGLCIEIFLKLFIFGRLIEYDFKLLSLENRNNKIEKVFNIVLLFDLIMKYLLFFNFC